MGTLRTGLCVISAVFGLLPVGFSHAYADSIDELYAKAKLEKTLALYGGGPPTVYESKVKEFEQKFPGVSVSIISGFSNELNQQIDTQLRNKKVEVDITFLQTLQDFVRWEKAGVLLPFKPEGFEQIHPSFKDGNGAFTGVAVTALPYAYNTELVRPADIPKSAPDFLKPEFRGKFVAVYPHDNDVALYTFYLIAQKYGWGYMDKLMAYQPNFIQGHPGVIRSIASGQNLVTFDGSLEVQLQFVKQGQPVGMVFSTVDPTPIWPLSAAIFKQSPHPNAAKLYLTWYLMKEQQSRTGMWSSRADVAAPAGLSPIFSYLVANTYRDFITNEELVADLRKRFETYTGPIVNKGGVR